MEIWDMCGQHVGHHDERCDICVNLGGNVLLELDIGNM